VARAARAAQAAQGRSAGRRTGSRIRHHPYVRPSSAGRRTGRRRGAILARSDDEDEVDGPAKNKATDKNEEKVKEEAKIQKKRGQMQKEGDKIQEEGDEIQDKGPYTYFAIKNTITFIIKARLCDTCKKHSLVYRIFVLYSSVRIFFTWKQIKVSAFFGHVEPLLIYMNDIV
jgi:hypothetical protein